MSTSIRRVHGTHAEYLVLEEASRVEHEFRDGEIRVRTMDYLGTTGDCGSFVARHDRGSSG